MFRYFPFYLYVLGSTKHVLRLMLGFQGCANIPDQNQKMNRRHLIGILAFAKLWQMKKSSTKEGMCMTYT